MENSNSEIYEDSDVMDNLSSVGGCGRVATLIVAAAMLGAITALWLWR